MGVIAALCQPFVDGQAVLNAMPAGYDIDLAVGVQLDTVGQWVGESRNIQEPLTGVYFSLDITGLGLDQGYLQGPYDPSTGVVSLDDETFRTLLYAKVANNQWAGTVPSVYGVLAPVFPGGVVVLQDNSDMSMFIGVIGTTLNAAVTAMLENGLLDLKPVGVRIAGYIVSPTLPIFGLDVENSTISGLAVGSLVTPTGGR